MTIAASHAGPVGAGAAIVVALVAMYALGMVTGVMLRLLWWDIAPLVRWVWRHW